MKFLEGLNERQTEAVLTVNGPLLVLAGAGSGKTSVVTRKIAYLMDNLKVYPSNILAITFTNKAAQEMKSRVEKLVGSDFDMWIGTFHKICVRILRRYIEILGYDSSFTIYDTSDGLTVVKDIIKNKNLSSENFKPKSILSNISSIKNSTESVESLLSESIYTERILKEIYYEYERTLKRNNALDFDDLILKTVKLLKENKDVREYYQNKFSYIFVDEYQDTNKSQYELVKLIAGSTPNLTVVGDNDQSIYAWRGADITNILNFENDFKNAKVILLEQNYRSTKNILDAANSLISYNESKYKKNLFTTKDGGETVKYKVYETSFDEEKDVISSIEHFYGLGKSYSDMAILYRTNAQSRGFEERLMRSNIPYQVVGGLKFYDRKEVKDIIAYMKVVANPDDEVSLFRIINTPKRGIGQQTVNILKKTAQENKTTIFDVMKNLESYGLNIRAKINLEEFSTIIDTLRKKKDKLKISEFIESVAKVSGYIRDLEKEGTVEAKTRIENIEELINSSYEFENNLEDANLEEYLSMLSLLSDIDKEEKNDGVSLMTVHGAKGLEFPIVFLVGMEERVFPSGRSMDEDENVEEERRLCYVAITRAKEELHVSSCKNRNSYGQPVYNKESRFIKEMGDIEHLEAPEIETPVIEYTYAKRNTAKTKVSGLFSDKKETKAQNTKRQSASYSISDKVSHKIFGKGMIVAINEKDDDEELVISFDNGKIKRLMKSLAPLEKLNE